MPTIAELHSRKAELEDELALVQRQLLLAEREQREQAALQALDIMQAHGLTISDVRPSQRGRMMPAGPTQSEHDQLAQQEQALLEQAEKLALGGSGNPALDALLAQKAAVERQLIQARRNEKAEAVARVRAIMDEHILTTADLAANMGGGNKNKSSKDSSR
jgi:hypothetical protein